MRGVEEGFRRRRTVELGRKEGQGELELTTRQHGHHDREAIHNQRENRP